MKLKELFGGVVDIRSLITKDVDIISVHDDSRKVEESSVFFVLKGASKDGAQFINHAVKNGAVALVYDKNNSVGDFGPNVCLIPVENPREVLKNILLKFYGNASHFVKAIGVTGTNGKTTITYLVSSILQKAKFKTSIIGTIHHTIDKEIFPSDNTTPGMVDNHKWFYRLKNEKIDHCIMEVSSHALDQGRVDLIDFRGAIFSNLTSDHLDYHKTRENYFAAKSILFRKLNKDAYAVVNLDDEYGQKLITLTKAKVVSYGINAPSDFQAKNIRLDFSGTSFELQYPGGQINIQTKLFGLHNVYNLLAAIACCMQEGIDIQLIKKALAEFSFVPGRLERVESGHEFSIFIDYAHTQDALLNVLQTIRRTTDARIVLVFGCGGDRDKTKRPKMGEVASQWADHSIVTSDNPRGEDPQAIIDEIIPGFTKKNYAVVVNREEAIAKALSMAAKNDIVLIAGKGHETYQIFKDRTIDFDEREIIKKILLCSASKKS